MAKIKKRKTSKGRVLKVCDLTPSKAVTGMVRSKRTVCIVFEDVGLKEDGGDNDHFNVYVTGLRGDLVDLSQDKWTPAEYWGAHAFQVVIEMVRATGAINKISKRSENQ